VCVCVCKLNFSPCILWSDRGNFSQCIDDDDGNDDDDDNDDDNEDDDDIN
jgi:hypothetical protein